MKAKPMKAARFSADGRFIVASSDDKFVRVWDAATGGAVTPLLPHEDHVMAAFVTAAAQLVTVSVPCVVRVWNLAPSDGPDRDLADYARLLAGGSLKPADSLPSADAGELAALLRSVRVRQPRLFASAPDRLREWHRRQAREPEVRTPVQPGRWARCAPDSFTSNDWPSLPLRTQPSPTS